MPSGGRSVFGWEPAPDALPFEVKPTTSGRGAGYAIDESFGRSEGR
jgi:hypothetical protein